MEKNNNITTREVHLSDYFMVLKRSKWLVTATVLILLSATALHLERKAPVYQAQAKVIIEPKQITEVLSSQSLYSKKDRLDLETQIAAIRTTPVLASVISQLGLTKAPVGSLEFSRMIDSLRQKVKVKLIENTRLATISTTDTTPEGARDIANAVAHACIDQRRLSRLQSGRDTVRWLSAQMADLKTKLRNSEEVFQEFREREGMITLDDRQNAESEEIAELSASHAAARNKRLEIEAIINELEQARDLNAAIPIALLDSPTLQKLDMELGQLRTELVDKRKLFKDKYPGIIELKDRIKFAEQRILSELKLQRDFLGTKEASLLAQQNSKRNEILMLGRKGLEYLALEREVMTNREMYNALLPKVRELDLVGESDLNDIRILELAELPIASMGGKKTTLILSGVLGFLLGSGLALSLKYFENTVRTPDDVEQDLDLPVLGVVPQVPEAKASKTPLLMMSSRPRSAPAEAYRSLRANILLSWEKTPPKTIVVTSAGADEGKSITVANLGMALAQAGKKVLLMDADLRRPTLHRIFHLDRATGLSRVLAEEITLSAAIAETDVPNLSVLAAGAISDNPSETLGSDQIKELICQLKEQYDAVLLDSAPVLGMADTVVLASEADAVVMVIKAGEPTLKALKIALAQLERVGSQICGVVLNNVDAKSDKRYGCYYYSPYGYDEEEMAEKRQKRRRSGSQRALAGSHSGADLPREESPVI